MRKVEESAQPIDLERKIKVEVSLAELLAIKAAVGHTNDLEISDIIEDCYPKISKEYDRVSAGIIAECVYDDAIRLLYNEGIREGVE